MPTSIDEAAAFESLLARLHPDRDVAGQEYNRLQQRLITFFEVRGCDDPWCLAIDTLNIAGRRILEGAEINPTVAAYALGCARRVVKEYWKGIGRDREAMQDPRWNAPPQRPPDEDRLSRLEEAIRRLPREDRELLERFHLVDKRKQSRKSLAEDRGITPNALRIQAHRIRKKLLSWLTDPDDPDAE